MKDSEQIKKEVREKYGRIASGPSSSCGCGCQKPENDYSVVADDYSHLEGYNPDADLKLGCGIPTEYAMIEPGDTVVDLGSGAGNDCFVARALTGETGQVIGIDFTDEMVGKAQRNVTTLGYENVRFVKGEIEQIPLNDETADVVVSNCVMNLVPDKNKAFSETYRILKKGGHFSISDIVTHGDLPEGLKESAAMYAGCVAGAIDVDDYLEVIKNAGFKNISIQSQKTANVPESVMLEYISREELEDYKRSGRGIFSVTVYGEK